MALNNTEAQLVDLIGQLLKRALAQPNGRTILRATQAVIEKRLGVTHRQTRSTEVGINYAELLRERIRENGGYLTREARNG